MDKIHDWLHNELLVVDLVSAFESSDSMVVSRRRKIEVHLLRTLPVDHGAIDVGDMSNVTPYAAT
jgi:hypothetical protein